MTNISKIRFKGFTDPWEQRELWDVTTWDKKFNEVESYKQPKVIKYPYVLADVFKNIEDPSGDVFLLSTGNYEGYTTEEKAGDNLCVGEVVTIPWGGVPNIKYYKGKFVTADNRLSTSNDIDCLDNKYLFYWFCHNRNYLEGIYRGASIKHPSMNDVLNMKIQVPSLKEQLKIKEFLSNVDSLITLHQRKYDKLVNIKKSMLEKMFPKNDKSIPEVRFKKYKEVWNNMEFGEMASYKKGPFGSALKKSLFVPKSADAVKVYEQQNAINKNWKLERYYITKEYASKLSDFETHAGDILVSCAGTIGEIYELPKESNNGIINQALMRVRVNNTMDKGFYKTIFSNMIDDFSKEHSNGSAMKNIPPFSDLKSMISKVPDIKEQESISHLFDNINNLINLYKCRIEKLNNIKKAFLDKMFI